jgi:hypothetical protein
MVCSFIWSCTLFLYKKTSRIAYNSSDLVVTELIQQLWQFYKRVGSVGGGGPGSTTGSGVSSAVMQSSSRGGPAGGRQVNARLFDQGGGREDI